MLGKPPEHLLRGLSRYEYLRGAGERDPFTDIWRQSRGLPAAARPNSDFRLVCLLLVRSTGGDEPEAPEDAASLVRGEIGPVEARCACDYLLGRKAPPKHDNVVLLNRVRQAVLQAPLDATLLELEPVSRDGEMRHSQIVFSDPSFLKCL